MSYDQPEPVVVGAPEVDYSPAVAMTEDKPVAIIEPDKKICRVTVQFAPCPKCKTNKRVICWVFAGVYKCNGCGLIGFAYQYQKADQTIYYQLEEKRY